MTPMPWEDALATGGIRFHRFTKGKLDVQPNGSPRIYGRIFLEEQKHFPDTSYEFLPIADLLAEAGREEA